METIFVSKDNKQEYIEVDDFVRQGDYKYTSSDNSATALKSEQADLVVAAAERFAQVIPLNMQEIFLWYFEQGVNISLEFKCKIAPPDKKRSR